MFFYKEEVAVDAWANATVFTENFDQAIDTDNNWEILQQQGAISPIVNGGQLNLSTNSTWFSAISNGLGLKNSNFTILNNTKATRIQVKVFVEQLDNNDSNCTAICLRRTYNAGGVYIANDGYRIVLKKESNVNKIQFMTAYNLWNGSGDDSGGHRYDLDTFNLSTWYNLRIDTFPTATTEIVRIYKETTLDSGVWTLLAQYEFD